MPAWWYRRRAIRRSSASFVNPAIKKKLCDTWTGDRSVLGKIRPIYGHDAHFHIRMRCPEGASGCKPQAAVPPGDGCDKSLAWWFTKEPWAAPKKDPSAKPAPKPRAMQVSDLPKACAMVLDARGPASEFEVTYQASGGSMPGERSLRFCRSSLGSRTVRTSGRGSRAGPAPRRLVMQRLWTEPFQRRPAALDGSSNRLKSFGDPS